MREKQALAVLLGVLTTAACGREQWLVQIETDARVPQFGDRILVEVLDAAGGPACPGCRQVFEAGVAERWPLTFGVSPGLQRQKGLLVRAQLFRSDHLDVGPTGEALRGGAMLDALGWLPEAPDAVRLPLRMDCAHVAAQIDGRGAQTCDAQSGALGAAPVLAPLAEGAAALRPGGWPLAENRSCVGEIPAGMVCIPGGAFVRGGLRYFGAPLDASIYSSAPEKLVLLRPFALDINEFTVADWAALRAGGKPVPVPILRGAVANPMNPNLPGDPKGLCHATGTDQDRGNLLPLNCVTQDQAAALCQAEGGKVLPTEAQWEYAAGNLTDETEFPWGANEDICSYTVVGRSSIFFESGASPNLLGDLSCRVNRVGQIVPFGPVPVQGDALDVTARGVRGLGGNVSEWCADRMSKYADSCMGRNPQRTWEVDPLCQQGTFTAVRGGSWLSLPLFARATQRNVASATGLLVPKPDDDQYLIGFRCALPR